MKVVLHLATIFTVQSPPQNCVGHYDFSVLIPVCLQLEHVTIF